MSWGDLIHHHVIWLRVGHSAATVELRNNQLHHFAATINAPPNRVSPELLLAWLAVQPWCSETRRSYRTALRMFFAWALKQGYLPTDPAAGLPVIPQHVGVPRPTPDRVWAAARRRADGRVWLMLRLAGEAGLRRGEIAQLHRRDLIDGPSLVIHGKGGKQRIVPVGDAVAAAVSAADGWVFPNGRGTHLQAATVGELCSQALPDGFTLHTARHRFASRAYQATHDLRAIQELLGHSSVATTQRYIAVDDDELRAVAAAAG